MEGHLLELIGTLVGLLYLYLEYRASIYLWIASIVMPAIYLVVYYEAGLYADFGINVYYLCIAVYGWVMWRYGALVRRKILRRKSSGKPSALPIRHTPRRCILPLCGAFVGTFVAIAYILIHYTDSTVPWLDSFTTALSIVAMWMLARKYVEQWWVWIGVDIVSAGLYVYKGLYPTAALYGLYAVVAVFGYLKWKQSIDEE